MEIGELYCNQFRLMFAEKWFANMFDGAHCIIIERFGFMGTCGGGVAKANEWKDEERDEQGKFLLEFEREDEESLTRKFQDSLWRSFNFKHRSPIASKKQ